MTFYEYRVVEVRDSLIGGKQKGSHLQDLLNSFAAHGWQLKAITKVDVGGRVGPGGVQGVIVTFERPVMVSGPQGPPPGHYQQQPGPTPQAPQWQGPPPRQG